MSTDASSSPSPSNWGGRLWMAGMGLSMAAAGAFFMWFLWKNFDIATAMDTWVETPCTILASTIDDSQMDQHFETKYEFQTSYRYEFGGVSYLGDQVKSKPIVAGIRKKLEKWETRFPSGSKSTCLVNPESPAEAVLVPDTKASIYSVWFPGLFVVGGLGVAISGLLSGGRTGRNRLHD
ncbi:MAG: DUF3592 domain-containing protein [Verrucomicrobiae bacterium]|nr:DUF3592 domain-containing protein [Verrucomicrobiae bacterium]